MQIARGVTRTVLLTRRYAVKIPRLSPAGTSRGLLWSAAAGLLANLSEREWSGWPGTCPVLRSWLGGLVNVYPRCAPVPPGVEIDYSAISPPGLALDPKPHNVGMLDGRTVWVDYADSGECVACARFKADRR